MKSKLTFSLRQRCVLWSTAVAAIAYNAAAKPALLPSDVIQTKDGVLRITPKFHGSVQLEFAGKVFQIDPVSAASYTRKADYILITHAHGDHFDLPAVKKLAVTGTVVVAPPTIAKELRASIKSTHIRALNNGNVYAITPSTKKYEAMTIEAVPMYNIVHEREKGKKFHPKGAGNGYILTLGGKRIYVAGDTEATPEMKKLKKIDIAFLPMNLPFTMTPQEAAKGARAFKPKIVYPYHFRYPFNKPNNNARQFAAALKGSGIQVRVREWYPTAAVARATAAARK